MIRIHTGCEHLQTDVLHSKKTQAHLHHCLSNAETVKTSDEQSIIIVFLCSLLTIQFIFVLREDCAQRLLITDDAMMIFPFFLYEEEKDVPLPLTHSITAALEVSFFSSSFFSS